MKLVWWMRGGLQLDDAYLLGREDQEIFNDIIKENLDTAKEIGQPFWQDYFLSKAGFPDIVYPAFLTISIAC